MDSKELPRRRKKIVHGNVFTQLHPGCDECEYRINEAKDRARSIGLANRARFDPDAPRSVFTPSARIIDRGD